MTNEPSQRDRDQTWDRRAEESANNWTFHPWRTAGKYLLVILLIFGALSLLGNAVGIVSLYWQAGVAKHTIKPRVTKRVYTPDNAIRAIAFFHDQCEGVNAQAKIVNNNAETLLQDQQTAKLAKDPIQQQQALQALQQDSTNLAGAKNILVQRAADYNSKSQQSTTNVFKGHGLPRRIDPPSDPESLARYHVNCGAGK